jgi:hypothetical protein
MERLTEIKTHVTGLSYTDKKEGIFAQNVYAKLAAYEDTGLTPAQVEAMKMDMEQLRADNINAEMNLAHMTADKDEQARKTRQLEEGLRSTLKVLETLNYRGGLGLDIHKWLRDEMQTVNALLGGKEDV